jgi:hypothetical protein
VGAGGWGRDPLYRLALPPWPVALGFSDAVGRGTPAVVGYSVRCTFVENFDSTYYFSKIMPN